MTGGGKVTATAPKDNAGATAPAAASAPPQCPASQSNAAPAETFTSAQNPDVYRPGTPRQPQPQSRGINYWQGLDTYLSGDSWYRSLKPQDQQRARETVLDRLSRNCNCSPNINVAYSIALDQARNVFSPSAPLPASSTTPVSSPYYDEALKHVRETSTPREYRTADDYFTQRTKGLSPAEINGLSHLYNRQLVGVNEGRMATNKDGTLTFSFPEDRLKASFDTAAIQYMRIQESAERNAAKMGMPKGEIPNAIEGAISYAKRHRIPAEEIPDLFEEAARPETQKELERKAGEKLSPERMPKIQQKLAERSMNFKERMGSMGPGAAVGGASWFLAEELAGALEIEDPRTRFAFVITTMHGTTKAASAVWNAVGTAVVEKTGVRGSVAALGSMARGLVAETMTTRGLNVAKGGVTMVRNLEPGMRTGLLASFVAMAAAQYAGASPEATGTIGTVAFFSPQAAEILLPKSVLDKIKIPGSKLAGRALFAAMAVEMGAGAMQGIVAGGESDYMANIAQRHGVFFTEHLDQSTFQELRSLPEPAQTSGLIATGAVVGLRSALEFVMPGYMNQLYMCLADDESNAFMDSQFQKDRTDVHTIHQTLPERVANLLLYGIGDEADESEFYESVDLERLSGDIEIEDNDDAQLWQEELAKLESSKAFQTMDPKQKEKAMTAKAHELFGQGERFNRVISYLSAVGVQQDLRMIRMVNIPGEPASKIVDSHGRISNGTEDLPGMSAGINRALPQHLSAKEMADEYRTSREDAFLLEYAREPLGLPKDATADDVRNAILVTRRANRLERLASTDLRLGMALDLTLNLLDADPAGRVVSQLPRNDIYFSALTIWINGADVRNGQVAAFYQQRSHVAETSKDPAEARAARLECMIIDRAMNLRQPKSADSIAVAEAGNVG